MKNSKKRRDGKLKRTIEKAGWLKPLTKLLAIAAGLITSTSILLKAITELIKVIKG